MKNIDEINDNINELILQKSFDKLTVEEKEKALAYAGTEEQYTSLRSTLLAITTSFNFEEEISVDQELKSDLLDQFEKKFGSSTNRVKIVPLYRKPFFQLAVAASVAILVIFSMPFITGSSEKQGQLAMTSDTKVNSTTPEGTIEETVMKDLSVSHESTAPETETSVDKNLGEKGPLEEKLSESEPSKDMDVAPVIVDDIRGDEILSKEEEKNEKGKDRVVVESKSKPNNNNTNTISLLDQLERDRKEKNAELKKRSKSDEKTESDDLANNNAQKSSGTKKMDADKMLESAAGSVNEAYSPAPASVLISSNVSTFVQENKTEILDLLFTTF